MAGEVRKIYEFGAFSFDGGRLSLEHNGETVQLPQRSLQTLKVLLEQRGETVTREHLLDAIWQESFVEDANLTVAVSALRKALSAFQDENLIQTVPRTGYRFIADVRERVEVSGRPIAIERHSVEHLTIEASRTADRAKRRVYYVLVSLLVLTAAAGGFAVWRGGNSDAKGLSGNPDASNSFIRGDALLQKRQVCESVPYFREATSLDDNFAMAFAELGAALAMCGDANNEADRAVATALALDPELADAHASDGFIKLFRHWDWPGAEQSLRRAIALDPNSAKAHHWLGVCLSIRGRLREAIGEMNRAIDLEPSSALFHADLCQVHYFELNAAAALNYCQKAEELDADLVLTPAYLRDVYLLMNEEQKAADALSKYWLLTGMSPKILEDSRQLLTREGFKGFHELAVKRLLGEMKTDPSQSTKLAYQLAEAYAGLHDTENTLYWLDQATSSEIGMKPFFVAYLAVEPRFAFLSPDPRFQAILRRLNLTDQ